MIRNFTFCILVILLLAACEQQPDAPSSGAVEVTDYTGRTIRLAAPAERVVALAPHLVENIFTAGAGDTLVGVVEYSNYPLEALSIPIVGGYEKTNHEKILELNPDLILAWESGNSHSSVKRLRELGFPVYINQPDKLEDVARSIRDIGVLTGRNETAEEAATEYLSVLEKVRTAYRNVDKVTAFYQVWNKPLQTINGQHIISDAMATCGGVNIYADEFAVAPVINIESILERDPQVIIASGMSSARPEWLDDWLEWPALSAVKEGNLFFVNPDHIQRHTVRILLGIESICLQLDEARSRSKSE